MWCSNGDKADLSSVVFCLPKIFLFCLSKPVPPVEETMEKAEEPMEH